MKDSHLIYKITPTAGTIIEQEAQAAKMPPTRYLNTLILNSHMECKYKLLVETFQSWLEKVVQVCHSSKKHEPEYCVVLHQLERYKKQFLGDPE